MEALNTTGRDTMGVIQEQPVTTNAFALADSEQQNWRSLIVNLIPRTLDGGITVTMTYPGCPAEMQPVLVIKPDTEKGGYRVFAAPNWEPGALGALTFKKLGDIVAAAERYASRNNLTIAVFAPWWYVLVSWTKMF